MLTNRIVIDWTLSLLVTQGRMKGVPYETRTHLWRFASLACKPLYHPSCPILNNRILVVFTKILLRCGTRPYEWGTQWNWNPLIKVCYSCMLTITPPEAPYVLKFFLSVFLRCGTGWNEWGTQWDSNSLV